MNGRFSNRLNRWIFHSWQVTPEGLGLYRIFVSCMILFFLLPPSEIYGYLGSLPGDFFQPPPGPMQLFHGFPSEEVFWTLHLGLILAVTGMLFGFRTRFCSLMTGFLLLAIKGFFFSLGKINHDLLLSVVPILFAFSNWGAAFSLDAARMKRRGEPGESVQSWPITLLALLIGFMFFTAGFPKILGGWLDPSTQATYGHFLNQYLVKDRTDLLANFMIGIESVWFWEFLDYATLLFEIGFLLAIFHPLSTRIFICVAVVFHFFVMAMMNIAFLFNFVAYAAFLDWDRVNRALQKSLMQFQKLLSTSLFTQTKIRLNRPNARGAFWLLALTIFFLTLRLLDRVIFFPGGSDLLFHEVVLISLAFPFAFYAMGHLVRRQINGTL